MTLSMYTPEEINSAFPESSSSPWVYEGKDDLACVLTHGFTGVPFELRPIGKKLMDADISHVSLLLPGHGETIKSMAEKTWQDWYKKVQDETLSLKKRYSKVIAIGFSMGGTLALKLASENLVDGVISLSSAAKLMDRHMFLARYVSMYKLIRNKPRKEPNNYLIDDKFLGYPNHPYAGIYQLYLLIRHVQKTRRKVEVPALLIHSKKDQVVPYENMAFIEKRISSEICKTVTLEKSNHVITWDVELDMINESIIEFLEGFKK